MNEYGIGETREIKDLVNKSKISDQVLILLSKMILSGQLKSGERIVETRIAKMFEVSQAPVREALRELEMMGMVESKPYSGCVVLPINRKKIQQIYELRNLLESYAVEQGIQQLTAEDIDIMRQAIEQMNAAYKLDKYEEIKESELKFHGTLIKSAKNYMLEKLWKLVGPQQWSSITLSYYEKEQNYFANSHEIMLEHLIEGNLIKAKEELKNHFSYAYAMLEKSMPEDGE